MESTGEKYIPPEEMKKKIQIMKIDLIISNPRPELNDLIISKTWPEMHDPNDLKYATNNTTLSFPNMSWIVPILLLSSKYELDILTLLFSQNFKIFYYFTI